MASTLDLGQRRINSIYRILDQKKAMVYSFPLQLSVSKTVPVPCLDCSKRPACQTAKTISNQAHTILLKVCVFFPLRGGGSISNKTIQTRHLTLTWQQTIFSCPRKYCTHSQTIWPRRRRRRRRRRKRRRDVSDECLEKQDA